MTATKTRRTLEVVSRIDGSYLPAVLVRAGREADAYCVHTAPGVVLWSNRRVGEGTTYRVACVRGVPAACTCPAGRFGRACKHKAATAKLIEVGQLDAPADERDTPDGWLCSVE